MIRKRFQQVSSAKNYFVLISCSYKKLKVSLNELEPRPNICVKGPDVVRYVTSLCQLSALNIF